MLAAAVPLLAAAPAVDKGKTLGSPSAPVTLEVFSDFACPACRAFHEQTLPKLIQEFVRNGKVYIVSREFPLTNGRADDQHKYSREAAAYATAAARIGKYSAVSDRLFATQANWYANGKLWDTFAGVLKPEEQKKVLALAKDQSVIGEVEADRQYGMASGINSTPTVFVTRGFKRTPLSGGVLEYSLLRQFLNDLLK